MAGRCHNHFQLGGFRWVSIDPNEVGELTRCDKGYLQEVDVKYPKELHDLHDDLPFMCKRMKINEDPVDPESRVEKLVPNLYDKKNYIIHIWAVDQTLKPRLVLERIHHAIEFDQPAWMEPYLDFITQLRTKATKNFEKDLFKLHE